MVEVVFDVFTIIFIQFFRLYKIVCNLFVAAALQADRELDLQSLQDLVSLDYQLIKPTKYWRLRRLCLLSVSL